MATVLLVDGHSLAYRAFYALPVENFATTTGQPTNAVYGFTSMLINVLRDEQPDLVAVAFDVSRQTFRTAEYPDYKANRAKSPAEFTGQVALIQEVLKALGITVLEADGFEADDIIATVTGRARAAGLKSSDHFFGMLAGGQLTEQPLHNILRRLPDGASEIMCHPGLQDETLAAEYSWGYHWRGELAALCAPATRQILREQAIELISFREL